MSVGLNLIWEGRKITVAHIPDYCANVGLSHIEVCCDEPLPITETGYKSHFLPAVHLENYDGPLDFVRQWLDFEAAKPHWTKSEAASPPARPCLFPIGKGRNTRLETPALARCFMTGGTHGPGACEDFHNTCARWDLDRPNGPCPKVKPFSRFPQQLF